MRLLLSIALAALAHAAMAADAVRVIPLDPRFDQLISRGAKVEKIADGFAWVEGPAWNRNGNYLLFTDIPNNTVYKWRQGKGVSLFMRPSGYTGSAPFEGREPGANGLTFDREGRLVLAEHGDRRIARLESDGSKTTLASHYQGKRLNSPNDVVFKSNGDLYFTDPPFGLPKAFDDPGKELQHQGVYRFKPDGEVTLLVSDSKAPNGIAFSPDEKTLYVTDVAAARWLAYPVNSDGTLGAGRVFVDAKPFRPNGKGGADGLKVDARGNLFATGPGGLYLFAPDATLLGRIDLGVPTSNCAWGDDGSVLYVTADTAVYRIKTLTKGASF